MNTPMQLDIHLLRAGEVEIGVLPALGGALSHARVAGVDFLRPWTGEFSVRRTAAYPLVPFSNRIAQGHFSLNGQTHVLARNFGDHPHPLHGVGWLRAWRLRRESDSRVIMSLRHEPATDGEAAWPFAFDAEQWVEADPQGVTVGMRVHNRDTRPMPLGLGWHPFFPRHDGVTLQFDAQSVFVNDEDMLPGELLPLPKAWNFAVGRTLDYPGLDNCFSGWNGRAHIAWPGKQLGVRMEASEGLRNLVVMTPPAPANFFAFEPVSHANDAINRPEPTRHGLRILAPDQAWSAHMRLAIERMEVSS